MPLRGRTAFPTLVRRPPKNIGLEVCVAQQPLLERAKVFFFRYFERAFVLLLVLAMVGIHLLVDQKFAFLSFYYLPLILAGFCVGRRFVQMAGGVVAAVVVFSLEREGVSI